MSPWPVDGKTVTSILNYDLTNLANISMLYNNYYPHPPFLKEFQITLWIFSASIFQITLC